MRTPVTHALASIAIASLGLLAPTTVRGQGAEREFYTVEDLERALGAAPPGAKSTKPKFRGPSFEVGPPATAAEEPVSASTGRPHAVAIRVEFALNSAKIPAQFLPQASQVAALLRRHPEMSLAIRGHTDATGDPSANLALSAGRAENVRLFLIKNGVSADRLSTEGVGDAELLPGTRSDSPRNRRVEFKRTDI